MRKLQRYTPEFRAEAVKRVFEQGLSLETAAKRLAIPKGTLGNWMASAKVFKTPIVTRGAFSGGPRGDPNEGGRTTEP